MLWDCAVCTVTNGLFQCARFFYNVRDAVALLPTFYLVLLLEIPGKCCPFLSYVGRLLAL
jgi:hypothetical protein